MQLTRIVFSGVVTAIVGIFLGLAMAEIHRADDRPNAPSQYATAGAILGLLVGSGQEALRQLDHSSEEEI